VVRRLGGGFEGMRQNAVAAMIRVACGAGDDRCPLWKGDRVQMQRWSSVYEVENVFMVIDGDEGELFVVMFVSGCCRCCPFQVRLRNCSASQ
jgi:hypothetical protein